MGVSRAQILTLFLEPSATSAWRPSNRNINLSSKKEARTGDGGTTVGDTLRFTPAVGTLVHRPLWSKLFIFASEKKLAAESGE